MVLEKTLESPLDSKEIKLVHPKGNQFWLFTGRTDAKAEAPVLRPHDAKSWLIGKDPDAGGHWRQGEKGVTEDEMVGWHHQLNRHEFEQTLWDSGGHRSLVCYSPTPCKELDTTQWLNNNCITSQGLTYSITRSLYILTPFHPFHTPALPTSHL